MVQPPDHGIHEAIGEFISRRFAIHPPPDRRRDLLRRVEAAGRELAFPDLAAFASVLLNDPDDHVIDCLVKHLTIPETYFWREPEMFDALTRHMLPDIRHERMERPVRIWSAGCSSGEEAYSLAIALRRDMPDVLQWDVCIEATDINPVALAKAQVGVYGGWSFRNSPPWLHDHFTRVGDRRYAIDDNVRAMVRFSRLNLADVEAMEEWCRPGRFDIIFCRNVLMYLSRHAVEAITGRMFQALADPGFMAVSVSELSLHVDERFHAVRLGGTHFLRKDGSWKRARTAMNPTTRADALPGGAGAAEDVPSIAVPLTHEDAEPLAAPVVMPPQPSEAEVVNDGHPVVPPSKDQKRVLELAGSGRLADALALCDELLLHGDLDPGTHYLHAVILEESGRPEDALDALKRALYLDHAFVIAHFAQGMLHRRLGRRRQADRSCRNVIDLLDGTAEDTVIPWSDGLNAGQVRDAARQAMNQGAAA